MRLFDPKFKGNVLRYILQCFFAMALIFITLMLIDTVSSMTVIASLGASTFIAFTMPRTNASKPRYLIGGYAVGCVCGILMNHFNGFLVSSGVEVFGRSPHILACAAAVGLAMFIMTAVNFEHPPAAALAMGLVLESDVLLTAALAMAGIVTVSLLKAVLKRGLKDLL